MRRRIVRGNYVDGLAYLGVSEVAELLGWDRRQVSAERSRGRMPVPAFILAAGPVWARETIEEWMRAPLTSEQLEAELEREIARSRQDLVEMERQLRRLRLDRARTETTVA